MEAVNLRHNVQPIKDPKIHEEVKDALLNNFKWGRRNLTIFQVGKATMLRVSDVLALRWIDVYDSHGNLQQNAFIHDRKTGKANLLYLKPVFKDLTIYQQWRNDQQINSPWLFPSSADYSRHINERQFYKVMAKVGQLLDIDYLGTHTMRKTGAYLVYQNTHDIAMVMKLLNHSSEEMTLHYLGIDQETKEHTLDSINFM